MSISNLKRYEVIMCHCALGEHIEEISTYDGGYLKFEEAKAEEDKMITEISALATFLDRLNEIYQPKELVSEIVKKLRSIIKGD